MTYLKYKVRTRSKDKTKWIPKPQVVAPDVQWEVHPPLPRSNTLAYATSACPTRWLAPKKPGEPQTPVYSMYVPNDDSDRAKALRLHELAHAAWSPRWLKPTGMKELLGSLPYTPSEFTVQVLEDARLNAKCARALGPRRGVMKHVGSVAQIELAGPWENLCGYISRLHTGYEMTGSQLFAKLPTRLRDKIYSLKTFKDVLEAAIELEMVCKPHKLEPPPPQRGKGTGEGEGEDEGEGEKAGQGEGKEDEGKKSSMLPPPGTPTSHELPKDEVESRPSYSAPSHPALPSEPCEMPVPKFEIRPAPIVNLGDFKLDDYVYIPPPLYVNAPPEVKGDTSWGELTIVDLTTKARYTNAYDSLGRRRERPTDEGVLPRFPHRMCVDGAVFSRRRNRNREGEDVLVVADCSGSMGGTDCLYRVLRKLPKVTLAVYSGHASTPTGKLVILARQGRQVGAGEVEKELRSHGNNTVDGPVVDWMLQQKHKRKVMVTDLCFVGVVRTRGGGLSCSQGAPQAQLAREVQSGELGIEHVRYPDDLYNHLIRGGS